MRDKDPIISMPLFIANIIILLIASITLLEIILFDLHISLAVNGILIRAMSAVAFIVILFWKIYGVITTVISITSIMAIITGIKKYSTNFLNKCCSEIVFLTLIINTSLLVAFLNSERIHTGKPDIEPTTFFIWFKTAVLCFLVIRIGLGFLVYYRGKKALK